MKILRENTTSCMNILCYKISAVEGNTIYYHKSTNPYKLDKSTTGHPNPSGCQCKKHTWIDWNKRIHNFRDATGLTWLQHFQPAHSHVHLNNLLPLHAAKQRKLPKLVKEDPRNPIDLQAHDLNLEDRDRSRSHSFITQLLWWSCSMKNRQFFHLLY